MEVIPVTKSMQENTDGIFSVEVFLQNFTTGSFIRADSTDMWCKNAGLKADAANLLVQSFVNDRIVPLTINENEGIIVCRYINNTPLVKHTIVSINPLRMPHAEYIAQEKDTLKRSALLRLFRSKEYYGGPYIWSIDSPHVYGEVVETISDDQNERVVAALAATYESNALPVLNRVPALNRFVPRVSRPILAQHLLEGLFGVEFPKVMETKIPLNFVKQCLTFRPDLDTQINIQTFFQIVTDV
jgi:hypothetical protein